MTRVIHTGDTHLGYRQYHSPERRRDFLAAFEGVVDDALDEGVDAVVHAGDLFHDRRPDLQDLLGTLSALRRLREAGIPFLAIVGNHEATRGGQWLDLFERLDLATRLGAEPTVVGNTAFYGLDHVPRSKRDDLDYDFAPHDADYAALVAHGLFTPFAHADWETESVLAASTVDFDAMLLGDNHTPDTTTVSPAVEEGRNGGGEGDGDEGDSDESGGDEGDAPDETWVTYSGSTERTSADEREARGYNLVTFDPETGVDIRRRTLDTRRFVFVSVDLAAGEGVERVREQVAQHDLDGAVVIVEVTGEGDPVAPASVEEFATEQGALIARVTDRREVETDDDLSVSFADPDAAVRERVDDLGLSPAALDVDEAVRKSAVADSNVRETVKSRIADRLEADGPDAFVPAPDQAAENDGDVGDIGGAGDVRGDGDVEGTDRAGAPADGAPDAEPTEVDADETVEGEDETAEGEDETATDEDREPPVASTSDDDAVDPAETDDEADDPDRQVSMEDFL